jgi:hypothetical protein
LAKMTVARQESRGEARRHELQRGIAARAAVLWWWRDYGRCGCGVVAAARPAWLQCERTTARWRHGREAAAREDGGGAEERQRCGRTTAAQWKMNRKENLTIAALYR